MSATTGTIEGARHQRPVRTYRLAAQVLAILVTVLGIWAMVGRDAGSAPADIRPQEVTADRVEVPPGFRTGPNGEAFPRPFAPIQSDS
jgi:hypothetical protein